MVETLTPPAPKAAKYQADPRLLEARVKLAAHLGLPPDNVTITIGPKEKGPNNYASIEPIGSTPNAPTEEVHITIHKQGLDIESDRLREELRNAMAQLKPLADVAQFVPEVKIASKVAKDLKDATVGTPFNQKLLEWPGFSSEIAKQHVSVNDYAIEDVRSKAFGIEMNVRFPTAHNGDNLDSMQKFSEVTKGRFEGIREIMVERVLKYDRENLTKRGLNAEEVSHVTTKTKGEGKTDEQVKAALGEALEAKIKTSEAQVRAQFAKLQFNITSHNSRLTVTIRSPEQEAAFKEAEKTDHMYRDPENADALRNSNPLTSLVVGLTRDSVPATDTTPEVSPQLHKALARSFLFDKDKNPIPDFALIAGRKDIQVAIAKEMMRVLPKHPEKEKQFREMLSSPIFKQHELWHGSGVGQADVAKPYPFFERVAGENDTVDIMLTVRKDGDPAKNQVKALIEGLASITPGQQQAPAPQAPAAAAAPQTAAAEPQAVEAQAQAPATPEQAEDARQQNADVYKNIARDIIALHKAKNPGETWVNRTQDDGKDQTRPGPG